MISSALTEPVALPGGAHFHFQPPRVKRTAGTGTKPPRDLYCKDAFWTVDIRQTWARDHPAPTPTWLVVHRILRARAGPGIPRIVRLQAAFRLSRGWDATVSTLVPTRLLPVFAWRFLTSVPGFSKNSEALWTSLLSSLRIGTLHEAKAIWKLQLNSRDYTTEQCKSAGLHARAIRHVAKSSRPASCAQRRVQATVRVRARAPTDRATEVSISAARRANARAHRSRGRRLVPGGLVGGETRGVCLDP